LMHLLEYCICCGFLTLAGLRFRPYESHRILKWRLNPLPLS
jgi:hypothetical protein